MWKTLRDEMDFWNAYEGEQDYMLRSMHERMTRQDMLALQQRIEQAIHREMPNLEEMFWRLNKSGMDW